MQKIERQSLGRSLVQAHANRADPNTKADIGAVGPWVDTLVSLWIAAHELRMDMVSLVGEAGEIVKSIGVDAPAPDTLSIKEGYSPDREPTSSEAERENEEALHRNEARLAKAEQEMAEKAAAKPQLVDATGNAPLKAPVKQAMQQLIVDDDEEDEGEYPSI